MTAAELRKQPATKQLIQLCLELSLVSQVRGTSYDASPGNRKVETITPTGGIDKAGDREVNYRQKSAEYFARRLERLLNDADADKLDESAALAAVEELLRQAVQALKDWKRTPSIPGHDPARNTLRWKIRIANDTRSTGVIAGHYGTSRTSVMRYRYQYAGIEE